MITIIIGIVGLIAGYFFIKKFDQIDDYFFDSIPGYEPFGRLIVYASATVGALLGAVVMIASMAGADLSWQPYAIVGSVLFALMICASIFQAFIFLEQPGHILGKAVFMTLSCALALTVGFVGSVVVITVLLILAFLWIVLKMLASGGSSSVSSGSSSSSSSNDDNEEKWEVKDENGWTRELKRDGFNSYRDDLGHRWKDDGWGNVSRDD